MSGALTLGAGAVEACGVCAFGAGAVEACGVCAFGAGDGVVDVAPAGLFGAPAIDVRGCEDGEGLSGPLEAAASRPR